MEKKGPHALEMDKKTQAQAQEEDEAQGRRALARIKQTLNTSRSFIKHGRFIAKAGF